MTYTLETIPVYTGRDEYIGLVKQNGSEVYRTLPQPHEILARQAISTWIYRHAYNLTQGVA